MCSHGRFIGTVLGHYASRAAEAGICATTVQRWSGSSQLSPSGSQLLRYRRRCEDQKCGIF
jgi:hypothetical protein